MTSDDRPTQSTAVVFRYEKPSFERSKAVTVLARTDIAFVAVQTVRHGGENNLHMHRRTDGFWFVLSGRVRFYTTDHVVVADLGRHEGILIPRGYPYWFESAGDEDLELLQLEASAESAGSLEEFISDRTDLDSSLDLARVSQFGEAVERTPSTGDRTA